MLEIMLFDWPCLLTIPSATYAHMLFQLHMLKLNISTCKGHHVTNCLQAFVAYRYGYGILEMSCSVHGVCALEISSISGIQPHPSSYS